MQCNAVQCPRESHPAEGLALPLFVARVGADHKDLASAADDLAMFANALDAGSDLHRTSCLSLWRGFVGESGRDHFGGTTEEVGGGVMVAVIRAGRDPLAVVAVPKEKKGPDSVSTSWELSSFVANLTPFVPSSSGAELGYLTEGSLCSARGKRLKSTGFPPRGIRRDAIGVSPQGKSGLGGPPGSWRRCVRSGRRRRRPW